MRLRSGRWMKNAFHGCLIQVDTKHLRFGNKKYYQFTAVDCFSRVAFCRVFSSAGSRCARESLEEPVRYMPFCPVALQAGNGSEFLERFDEATEGMLLACYLSHPNRPRENACVERKIQTTKYELWAFREGYTVAELNRLVDEWDYTCNHIRPHRAPDCLTPEESLNHWMEERKEREPLSTM